MRLDSVRDLKQTLSASIVEPMGESAAIRSLGVPAGSIDAAAAPRTLALGVAPRETKGDFVLAVRVQRRGLEDSSQLDRIRRRAKGEVDIRYVGRIVKRAVPWHQRRQRPLLIGNSVGHVKVTAGTLGCFVRARTDGQVQFLSNNHVLANENRAKKGDEILQPGRFDEGSSPEDRIGSLGAFVRLKKIGANAIDAALGVPADDVTFESTKLRGLGTLSGVGDVVLDEGSRVAKLGRTTGLTRGRVTAFELDRVIVGFDIGDLRFDDQIEIEGAGSESFSQGGDSGSLIVDGDRRAVALLFAGGDQGGSNGKGLTYANPFRTVCDALKVDLLY